MNKIITIYCEGKRGSHDFDILEKVVGDIASIRPIGSKRGANAIFEFVEEKELKTKYGIRTKNDVEKVFIKIAKEIKNYQAVRHTLGQLRFPNSFDTTWIKDGSGHLPEKLDLETCKTEGWKLICSVVSKNNEEWTESNFQSKLDEYLHFFDERFFNELKFLVYFQGKDFAKALTNQLADFPLKDYYKFAKKRFDYKRFADLVALREIVEHG